MPLTAACRRACGRARELIETHYPARLFHTSVYPKPLQRKLRLAIPSHSQTTSMFREGQGTSYYLNHNIANDYLTQAPVHQGCCAHMAEVFHFRDFKEDLNQLLKAHSPSLKEICTKCEHFVGNNVALQHHPPTPRHKSYVLGTALPSVKHGC